MKSMNLALKTIGGLATLAVTYIDSTLTPLFWALLVLAAIDILLNVHKEGQQWNKLGSAFISLGGTLGLAGHVSQPDFLRVMVAVATLAYLQVVVPQLVTLVGNIKWSKDPATNAVIKQAELTALKKEIETLRSQADKQVGTTQDGLNV